METADPDEELVDDPGRRSRLEQELARFQRLVDAVGVALWDWDLQSGDVWRNNGLTTVFGYPTETLARTTQTWSDHIHPDDRDEVVASLQAAIDGTAETWTHSYRFLRHDGSVAQVRDRNQIVRSTDGRPVRVIGGITDITDRWRAEKALRASEARFRDLAEHSSEGIFVQDFEPQVRFTYLNPAMELITGYSREAIYADASLALGGISDEDRTRLWTALATDGGVTEPVDIDMRRADGAIRRIRLRGTPTRDDSGTLLRMQAAATDVTREHRERESLRRALEHQQELNDLKTSFVQAVSHELRTPLTTIRGFVELLLARELPREQQSDYLGRIATGAARLHRLVRDVLDLDRLDRPETVIDAVSVDLRDIARRVVEEAEATRTSAHLLHLEVRPAPAVADEALIERVIDNLVRNATKHTPEGTAVWVRTYAPATIVVEDAGGGIPEELREKLFEPFQRGPDQLEQHSPGTGIGLALASRIVHLHGGAIRITERPGGGARLTVTLPEPVVGHASPSEPTP